MQEPSKCHLLLSLEGQKYKYNCTGLPGTCKLHFPSYMCVLSELSSSFITIKICEIYNCPLKFLNVIHRILKSVNASILDTRCKIQESLFNVGLHTETLAQ